MFTDTDAIDLSVHSREAASFDEMTSYASQRASVAQIVEVSYRLLSESLLEAMAHLDEEELDRFQQQLYQHLPGRVARMPEQAQLAEFYLQTFRGMLNDRADQKAPTSVPAR